MTALTIKQIDKRFGSTVVLQDLSMTIDSGECVTLVGPSGSGKTTLLRIIAGLESPDQGKVLIHDKDVSAIPPHERDVAMVFQTFPLYPHLSIADNIAFPLKVQGMARKEMRRVVSDMAEALDLRPLLTRKPHTLSGGQRQQVALARALVRSPKVLLLDEPLSHVDAEKRQQQRQWLRNRLENTDTALLYVTHDQAEAMALGDRMVVLHQAEIQQIGQPLDLYQQPKNPFVAGFIGSPRMNLWQGSCETRESGDVFVTKGLEIRISKSITDVPPPHVLGIRPEALSLSQREAGQLLLGCGKLCSIEPLGMYSTVIVELSSGEVVLTVPSTSVLPQVGQETRVWYDLNAIHLWPA